MIYDCVTRFQVCICLAYKLNKKPFIKWKIATFKWAKNTLSSYSGHLACLLSAKQCTRHGYSLGSSLTLITSKIYSFCGASCRLLSLHPAMNNFVNSLFEFSISEIMLALYILLSITIRKNDMFLKDFY